jgi:Zn-dependent protease
MGLLILMVVTSLQINLALAIFNVLSIAPLDGSKILFGLLPARYEHTIYFLECYAPLILIGSITLGWATGVPIPGGLIWCLRDFSVTSLREYEKSPFSEEMVKGRP